VLDLGHERVGGGAQAAGVIALPEVRRNVLIDHTPRKGVGDRPFQSVSDFDPNLSLFDEDEEDQTVVELLVADLPPLRAADREVFQRFPFQRWEGVDDELRARSLLEGRQLLIQRVRGAFAENSRLVGDERGRRRRNVERERRRRAKQQRRKREG